MRARQSRADFQKRLNAAIAEQPDTRNDEGIGNRWQGRANRGSQNIDAWTPTHKAVSAETLKNREPHLVGDIVLNRKICTSPEIWNSNHPQSEVGSLPRNGKSGVLELQGVETITKLKEELLCRGIDF
jgi:hypothetical protein